MSEYCEQCGCDVPEGGQHDWVSHQPEEFQSTLKDLGFNGPLTSEQIEMVEARA